MFRLPNQQRTLVIRRDHKAKTPNVLRQDVAHARPTRKMAFRDKDGSDADSDDEHLAGDQSSATQGEELPNDFPYAQEVPIDVEQMYVVEYVAKTNPIAIASVSQIVNNLRAGGLTVTLDLMGAKVKLNELHQVGRRHNSILPYILPACLPACRIEL